MKKKYTIEFFHDLAHQYGGKCLSTKYDNIYQKLKWQCKEGHIFERSADLVKNSKIWCSKCKRNSKSKFKITKKDLDNLAKKRGGKCLSKTYNGWTKKLIWQCNKKHVWESLYGSVNVGHWCPICAGNKRKTIKDMQEIAKRKKGKCLSKKYINSVTKLKWQCKEGHIWETSSGNIKKHWCVICARQKISNKYKILRQTKINKIVKERNGVVLDENNKIYTLQCKNGHIFETTLTKLNNGNWCPYCVASISEIICRQYFEKLFNVAFKKIRPNWLRNKQGNKIELDGYNKDLRLAFEYNGEQHYKKIRSDTQQKYNKRQEYDKVKIKVCKQKGINLIVVPYTISFEDMGMYIISECKKQNIIIPNEQLEINYKDFELYNEDKLEYLQQIAATKGGKCLSKNCPNLNTKLKWECKNKHIWETTGWMIKQGTWCPVCAKNKRLTIKEMNNLAQQYGGKCLSTKYKNAHTKYKFKCKNGHIFWRNVTQLKYNHYWCDHCKNKNQ